MVLETEDLSVLQCSFGLTGDKFLPPRVGGCVEPEYSHRDLSPQRGAPGLPVE